MPELARKGIQEHPDPSKAPKPVKREPDKSKPKEKK